jgi:excisionase family DNA binding protein
MEVLLEKTTKADQRVAMESVEKLKKASKSGKSIQISQKPDQQSLRIPEKAMKLLIAILSNMADGKDTAVLSADTYISTQEAADYLRVSRPHLVDLLEGGDIPFVKVGTHRRIKLSDLVAFDKKRKRLMTKGLKFLAKQAQELGLYDID